MRNNWDYFTALNFFCPTCKGISCEDDDVPHMLCNKNIPKLPFELTNNYRVSEEDNYECLDIEYIEGK